jgi:hypothetical protein
MAHLALQCASLRTGFLAGAAIWPRIARSLTTAAGEPLSCRPVAWRVGFDRCSLSLLLSAGPAECRTSFRKPIRCESTKRPLAFPHSR